MTRSPSANGVSLASGLHRLCLTGILVVLLAGGLGGCGRKALELSVPEGAAKDRYPLTYPDPRYAHPDPDWVEPGEAEEEKLEALRRAEQASRRAETARRAARDAADDQ